MMRKLLFGIVVCGALVIHHAHADDMMDKLDAAAERFDCETLNYAMSPSNEDKSLRRSASLIEMQAWQHASGRSITEVDVDDVAFLFVAYCLANPAATIRQAGNYVAKRWP